MRTLRRGQSALLILDVAQILANEGVSYAVIGAFALTVLGVVRATTDVDALLSIPIQRLAKLRLAFAQAGFGAEFREGDVHDPIPAMLVLTDAHDNRVELLSGIRGMDSEILSRAFEIEFRGATLRVVGREDFIALKCYAAGPQDIVDAMSAYRAASSPVNLDLMRTVTRRFGRDAADNLERVLAGPTTTASR